MKKFAKVTAIYLPQNIEKILKLQ